jgi:hypothetical protein
MKIVNVGSEYTISSIGNANNIWTRMLQDVINSNEDKVVFDFKDVKLNQPWKNESFKIFITDKRVCMRLYNNEKIKKTIDALIVLSGNSIDGKVDNIEVIDSNVESIRSKNIKALTNKLVNQISYVKDKNGLDTLRFDVGKGVTQIGSIDTVTAISEALNSYAKAYAGKLKKIELNLTGVMIQENCYKYLANLSIENDFKGKGIIYEELDESYAKIKKLMKYRLLSETGSYTDIDKYNIVKKDIAPGSVVMLHLFKETKATNEFGQMDDGKYTISRPAIFLGYKKDGNNIILSFRTYIKDTFYTRVGYYVEHDMEEEMEKLETKTYDIKLADIGYGEKFTGRRGHFHLPLQFDKADSINTYIYNFDTERYDEISYTLPEYIKAVFDDHKVKYNEAQLNNCIQLTKNWLGM